MTDPTPEPTILPEPGAKSESENENTAAVKGSIWMRGLAMVITAILIGLAISILHVLTIVQFVLMLIDSSKPNGQIAGFGKTLGAWLEKAAAFQTAQSEDKPWPFSKAD